MGRLVLVEGAVNISALREFMWRAVGDNRTMVSDSMNMWINHGIAGFVCKIYDPMVIRIAG